MTVQIRHAKSSDIDEMYEIECESFNDPWERRELDRSLQFPGVRARIATVGGTVVGFIVTQDDEDDLKIINLAVARDYRRRGIARQLVELCAKKHKSGKILASVVDVNLDGHLCFKSLGFTCTGINQGEYEAMDGELKDSYIFERTAS
jgi:ribosomal-protein-alanine N-acetyltransferase